MYKNLLTYQSDYFLFVEKIKTQPVYITTSTKNIKMGNYNILYYKSKTANTNKRKFLISPSIFNSAEILFINDQENFVQTLLQQGDVFLINWQPNKDNLAIDEYVNILISTIDKIFDISKIKIDLIGHCFGGNIAFAAACFKQSKIKTLTLLTFSWDYSHFQPNFLFNQNLAQHNDQTNFVSKTYFQIMFFLFIEAQGCQNKFHSYLNLKTQEQKSLYLRVENWLQSGVDIPKKIYEHITHDLIKNNILLHNNWKLMAKTICPAAVSDIPVCIFAAEEDKISPVNSILPLHNQLNNSKLIMVSGGHISYLIKREQKISLDYTGWLKSF